MGCTIPVRPTTEGANLLFRPDFVHVAAGRYKTGPYRSHSAHQIKQHYYKTMDFSSALYKNSHCRIENHGY